MPDSPKHVLWVDDDAYGAFGAFRRLLDRSGLSVDIATSVEAAHQRLEETAYDTVIVDLVLPLGTAREILEPDQGYQLISEIKSRKYTSAGHEPEVIVLSAFLDSQTIEDLNRQGIKTYAKTDIAQKETLAELLSDLRGEVKEE